MLPLLRKFVALFLVSMIARPVSSQDPEQTAIDKKTTFGSINVEVYESTWDLFSPLGSPDLDELDITVAMQVSILSASVDNIAWLLLDFDDVLALGLGFRFPHENRDEYLRVSETRVNDPDVVAIRGMAAAALSLVNSTKIADVFLMSVYGPDFFYNVCSPNFKLELDAYGIPNCHVEEYFEQLRRNLTETFSDGDLMQLVLDTPPEPIETARRRRALMVAGGSPVDTWTCAYCFESSLCDKHAYWCPNTEANVASTEEDNDNNNKRQSG